MGFTPTFDVSSLMKGVRQEVQRMEEYILNELNYVGLEFVKNARSKVSSEEYKEALGSMSHAKGMRRAELGPDSPSFTDRTGALRSSIGYVILKNGKVMASDFDGDNSEGKGEGFHYAMSQSEANIGFVLMVVAGMQYAVYVEGYGYDVITGSSLLAEDELKNVFKKLESLK